MEPKYEKLFQDMYEEFQQPMRTIARHYNIPYTEIDDVIQDAFLAYLENYALDCENRGRILAKIVRNKCYDYFRKLRREPVSLDSEEGQIMIESLIHKFGGSPLNEIMRKELYAKVRKYVGEMRSEWREVILYCCVLEYTSEEAGEILGISGTACRSRLARARSYLKKKMKADLF